MRVFENQTFDSFDDRDSGATFCDVEFRRCHFNNCDISITHDPTLRSTVRNVRLVNCDERESTVGCAIIEDAIVDGLKTGRLFRTHGAVFKHVVLRGRIDNLMIANDILPSILISEKYRQEEIDLFCKANAEYYKQVDWALDISEGEFKELDIRGVPGRLIRRDPETQILLTRQRVLKEDWRDLEFQESLTPFSLDFMLKEGYEDMVMIAPKRHRKFPMYLADLQLLREEGIAEPD